MCRRQLIAWWVLVAWLVGQVGSVSAGDAPRTLTAEHPSLTWSVPCLDRSSGDRFVEVDIPEVVNPRSVELAFQVHYQQDGSEPAYLGGFSLFPPDRPGRFIVPTQGKVEQTGRILLSLEPLEDPEAAAAVQVVLGRVRLTDAHDLGSPQ
jgi:hypothetical protein